MAGIAGQTQGPIQVHANQSLNRSGVTVEAGKMYDITATGTWHDWYIECDADGWSWRQPGRWKLLLTEIFGWPFKRSRGHRFMYLMAEIEGSATKIPVGTELQGFVPEASGEICFYANDAWPYSLFYRNNSGYVDVTIAERGE